MSKKFSLPYFLGVFTTSIITLLLWNFYFREVKMYKSLMAYQQHLEADCQKKNVNSCIELMNFNEYGVLVSKTWYRKHNQIDLYIPWEIMLVHYNYWPMFKNSYLTKRWEATVYNGEGQRSDYAANFRNSNSAAGESPIHDVTLEISRLPILPHMSDYIVKGDHEGLAKNLRDQFNSYENRFMKVTVSNDGIHHGMLTLLGWINNFAEVAVYSYSTTGDEFLLIRFFGDMNDRGFMESRAKELISGMRIKGPI